jgi:DNA-binding XRE family transcriptional regulator
VNPNDKMQIKSFCFLFLVELNVNPRIRVNRGKIDENVVTCFKYADLFSATIHCYTHYHLIFALQATFNFTIRVAGRFRFASFCLQTKLIFETENKFCSCVKKKHGITIWHFEI